MKKILLFLIIIIQCLAIYAVPEWSVNSSDFEFSLTITGIVQLEGENIGKEGDVIAAFINGECRGVANAVFVESYNSYYFYLTVFSNTYSGDEITFKYYNNQQDGISADFDILEFSDGSNFGSVSDPYIVEKTVSGLKNINDNEQRLEVYPNPAKDFIKIDLSSDIQFDLKIYSATGKLVYINGSFTPEDVIDIGNYTPGLYIIMADIDNIQYSEKFIVK